MHLLVIILDKTGDLENLVHKFRDIGITGLTIFDSIGIGKTSLYGGGVPIIASLSRIFDSDTKTYNHTVFSVIRKEETLKQAIQVVEEVCGDFMKPDVGILFTIKLDSVIGFGTLEEYNKK
ncbi:hypothetical protein KAU08_05240 [bacterium]|nr:hypothetical protein [bacterium]